MRELVFGLLFAAGVAQGAGRPNPYLAQAKVFYQGLEYEKCIARLDQASNWQSDPAEQVEIELYSGLCHFNMGELDEAKRHFDLTLSLDSTAQLPPFTSPRISDIFEASRQKIIARNARKAPPRPPPEVKVTEKPPPKPPPDVKVTEKAPPKPTPPPEQDAPKVAQLLPVKAAAPAGREVSDAPQSGSYALPIALAGTGAVAAGVGVFFGVSAHSLATQANAAHFESDAFSTGQSAQRDTLVANVAFAVAATAAAGAVVSYFSTR